MRVQSITFIKDDNFYRAKLSNKGRGWVCYWLECNVEGCRRVRGGPFWGTDHHVVTHWRDVDLKKPTERTRLMVRALEDHANAAEIISIVDVADLSVKEPV